MALQDSIKQLQSVNLSELDFNNVGAWPTALKGIFLLILMVLIIGGGYYFYLSEKRAELQMTAQQDS